MFSFWSSLWFPSCSWCSCGIHFLVFVQEIGHVCIRGQGRQSGATRPLPSLYLPPGACAESTLQSYHPSHPCLPIEASLLFPPPRGGVPWPGRSLWFSPPLTSLSISPQETPLWFSPIFLAVLLWSPLLGAFRHCPHAGGSCLFSSGCLQSFRSVS